MQNHYEPRQPCLSCKNMNVAMADFPCCDCVNNAQYQKQMEVERLANTAKQNEPWLKPVLVAG